MKKSLLRIMVLAAVAAACVMAQKVKTTAEGKGFQDIQKAKTPDEALAAVDKFVVGFPESELKSQALTMASEAADQKGDFVKAISYGHLAIEADPKNFTALLDVAAELAGHTKDTDFDKADKLAESEKDVKAAQEIIPDAPKPNPQIQDAQWEETKKYSMAKSHFDLALVAMARKKPSDAASEYKLAVDGTPTAEPVWMIRLGNAYNLTGKPDDAIAVLDKVLAMSDLNPQYKAIAQREKDTAEKAKGKK